MVENAPPGWYHADTDPPGTERYWDGSEWSDQSRAGVPPPSATTRGVSDARITPHGREIASPWRRIGARMIDGLIAAVVWVPLLLPEFLSQLDFDAIEAGETPDISFSAGRLIAVFTFAAAYEVLFTAWRGATPGKMAVGIVIVRDRDGASQLGLGTAILRWLPNSVGWLLPNLSSLVGLASLILLFTHPLRRTVYDLVGQTYVVDKGDQPNGT